VAISDGYPGIDTTHSWSGGTVLNNLTHGTVRVKVDKVTGWYSLAESEDNKIKNTGRRGSTPLPSTSIGKTIVYEGRIQARTRLAAMQRAREMRRAFRDKSNLGRMTLDGNPDWFFDARVMQFDADDDTALLRPTAPYPFTIGFTLGLHLLDPRFYVVGEVVSATQASGATLAVTNEGDTDTDPVFEVVLTGGGGNILLENLSVNTSNGTAKLSVNVLTAGTVLIDFKNRSIKVGVQDFSGGLDITTSQWWDELIPGLNPGVNNIRVTGGAWLIKHHHASE
jgi:Phage tail protein